MRILDRIKSLGLAVTLTTCSLTGVNTASAADENFKAFLDSPSTLDNRYIVKFRSANGAALQATTLTERARQQRLLSARGIAAGKHLSRMNAMSVVLNRQQVADLRALSDVEYVELDPPRRLLSQTTPWGISAVEADLVSDSAASTRKVCIIDSGYDINNPDLAGNNHNGTNVSGTGNWFVPGGSHGSHVAGTIAAVNNSEGVEGVMPNGLVAIHIVKVFNESGWGYASDLIDAIGVCANAGAQVVNMSLGGSGSSTTERNALQSYADQGMLLIAAAGNDGTTAHSYPASYDSVVSVAAVDQNLDHAEFSQATSQVELSAPGEAVLSTVGVGDGVLASLTVGGSAYGNESVVPHNRYIVSGGSYVNQFITGQVSGALAACTLTGGSYNCSGVAGKICLAERSGNQSGGVYPEISPVLACANAGAVGAIVYSNTSLPGLQNPFLVDDNGDIDFPSVSVNRTTGQQLMNLLGEAAVLQTSGGEDYAWYNGTSMATPHVTGVAALVWSYHTECGPAAIRAALGSTAEDLGSSGRDNQTGYGLIQAAAAIGKLDTDGCSGGGGGGADALENGVAVTGLAGATGSEIVYTLEVPEGATDLEFQISGGSGDADLYVLYEQEPSSSQFDCRPYLSGNNESCQFPTPQAGTYYVKLIGYSAYSGVNLVGSYSVGGSAGQNVFSNSTDYTIPDNRSAGVYSPIQSTYSGVAGIVQVSVSIVHTYIGDLIVDVIAPDGTSIVVHNRAGGSADNINTTYTIDFGNSPALGEWRLRVRDRARFDTGYIDSWQIEFP